MSEAGIVADGKERNLDANQEHLAAAEERITREVREEFTQRMAEAGRIRRLILRFRMIREIRRRMHAEEEKVAPSRGLYLTDSTGDLEAPSQPAEGDGGKK